MAEIPDNVKKGLKNTPVSTVDEVIKSALVSELKPIEWDEEDELAALAAKQSDDEDLGIITH